jgi:hypothetical protein
MLLARLSVAPYWVGLQLGSAYLSLESVLYELQDLAWVLGIATPAVAVVATGITWLFNRFDPSVEIDADSSWLLYYRLFFVSALQWSYWGILRGN